VQKHITYLEKKTREDTVEIRCLARSESTSLFSKRLYEKRSK